ncbi:MAG: hypothetical protein ABI193_00145, partial [Minicystis sp.]
YCLRPEGKSDARCTLGPKEDLPVEGTELLYTTQLGAPLLTPPDTIDGNQMLAFSLFARKSGDTLLALLDSGEMKVTATPAVPLRVEVSGDRRFLTVVPKTPFLPDAGGKVSLHLTGQFLVDPTRDGLKLSDGKPGGKIDQTFSFKVRGKPAKTYAFTIPTKPGDPASELEIYRIAAPLPTILPSYNQIGFDSLHYLAGAVEGDQGHFIVWVAGAKLAVGENLTVHDPATKALFPLNVDYNDGLLTMVNDGGFKAEVTGANLTFSLFQLTARIDDQGKTTETPRLLVSTICSKIATYGPFLQTLGFCNTQTDVLSAFGASLLRQQGSAPQTAPAGIGAVDFQKGTDMVTAKLTGSALKAADHSVSILVVDVAKNRAVSLDYGLATKVKTTGDGVIDQVDVSYNPTKFSGEARVYLMIDTYPAATGKVTL